VNPHFSLLYELTSIVRNTDEKNEDFLKKISKLGDIDMLVLTGRYLDEEKDTDTDLFLVGDMGKAELQKFLDEQVEMKNVRFVLMTRDDFLYRVALKDKFVKKIFSEKDNIILKNKLKKDTESLLAS
jgi:hypothetical protein